LDEWSARRKASTYTGQHNTERQGTNIHALSGIRTHDPSKVKDIVLQNILLSDILAFHLFVSKPFFFFAILSRTIRKLQFINTFS
jgi:hypothetical protein